MLGRKKAAKNDDAEIDYQYWDDKILCQWRDSPEFLHRFNAFWNKYQGSPQTWIRKMGLRTWRRNVWRSFHKFIGNSLKEPWAAALEDPDVKKLWLPTIIAARDCLQRCMNAEWWEWSEGSRLLFWRWPHETQVWARDGLPVVLTKSPTPYRRPQPREADPTVRHAVQDKFDKFRRKNYVGKGEVLGLTSYFTVPKGEGDVRVVFDGTSSGLNNAIWSPTFGLPSTASLLAALEPGTWMADIDVGEMFYNFMLDPKLRPFCGVDLSPYYQDTTSWERWDRCVMGLKSSPYGCIRMDLLADEVNRGNHLTPSNPFHFNEVRLNLPGDPSYDLTLPWVSKIVSSTNRIAGDVKTYVDDKRPTGQSYHHCRQIARRTASTLSYLSMQDASRKRELPSQ
jgi:hypothetical protein